MQGGGDALALEHGEDRLARIAATSARAASRSSRAWSSPSSSASSASLFDQSRENRPFDFGGPTPAPAGRRRAFRPKLI